MALPFTGSISLSQVAVELSRAATAQTALGDTAVRNLAGLSSGAIGLFNLRGKSAAVIYTATNLASLNLATAFGEDYSAPVDKRLVVPAGVSLGPVTIPTGLDGTLTIENAGEIQGTGGASNGGAGGDAITASASFTLLNTGAVRGGGGGGGAGGNGGDGSTISQTQTTESPPYDANNYWRQAGPCGGNYLRFGGVEITTANSGESFTTGNITYTPGAYMGGPPAAIVCGFPYFGPPAYYLFAVSRTITATTTTYASGGAGGAGGQGRGYGQPLAAGSSGASGGTNAGTGGAGGTGGDWGQAGAGGNAGANGNHSSGAAGGSGGAAGRAVRMLAGSLTLTNNGIINGAT